MAFNRNATCTEIFSQKLSPSDITNHWTSELKHFEFNANNSATDPTINDLIKIDLEQTVTSLLCSFGIVGNILNIIVLSRGRMQAAMNSAIERSSRAGLIGLAVSDMMCCSSTMIVIVALLGSERVLFAASDPRLYVLLYGPYFQNAFMKASTWLTVVLAVERYMAICRPIHARYMVNVSITRATIFFTFLLSGLLELPTIWSYSTFYIDCDEWAQVYDIDQGRFYLVDQGPFVTEKHFKTTFTYIWAVVGFLVPAAILVFCNVHLVRALRESFLMGRLYRSNFRSSFAVASNRLTLTLVSIVCMFLVLVTPSELLHLFFYSVSTEHQKIVDMAMVITNVLQTANFAFTFVLYCIVNTQFRETWKDLLVCSVRRCRSGVKSTGSGAILTLQDRPNNDLYGAASRSQRTSNSCLEK